MDHPELYLLDTAALSEFALKEPHASFADWVATVPEGSLAISSSSVIETQRGVEKLKGSKPLRAKELDEWLTVLLGRTDIRFLSMNARAARIFGKMTSVPALKNLWVPDPRAAQPKLGQDLQVAATSIAYQAPIASPNVKDFMLIHARFPLPGLFNPLSGLWTIPHRATQPIVPDLALDAERIKTSVGGKHAKE
jgi:predicted nucleic acid-binding protein